MQEPPYDNIKTSGRPSQRCFIHPLIIMCTLKKALCCLKVDLKKKSEPVTDSVVSLRDPLAVSYSSYIFVTWVDNFASRLHGLLSENCNERYGIPVYELLVM